MKLISLNIWDARVFEPLMAFFETHQDIDIFCLQEVFNAEEAEFFRDHARLNGFNEISNRLPNHVGFFAHTEDLDDVPERGVRAPYGLAMFVKKNLEILSHHHEFIFGEGGFSNQDARTHRRVIQTTCIQHNGQPLAISNVHGLWNGQGKTDTPARIQQSQNIKKHIGAFNHPVILTGDFNLLPDTESLKIVKEGMRDLITEKGITSTRSPLYTKHTNPVLFADYTFVSPDVEVNAFEVLTDVVSDHSPLLLDFK